MQWAGVSLLLLCLAGACHSADGLRAAEQVRGRFRASGPRAQMGT
jgi:hypothetical protein